MSWIPSENIQGAYLDNRLSGLGDFISAETTYIPKINVIAIRRHAFGVRDDEMTAGQWLKESVEISVADKILSSGSIPGN